MRIVHYSINKANCANIYLDENENTEQYLSLIEELKKKYKVFIFQGGTDSFNDALYKGLSDI